MAANGGSKKIEGYIGLALLLLTILGFLLSLLMGLPKDAKVNVQANPLRVIPRDFFSADNEVTQKVKQLNVPSGVPVTVDPSTLGRGSVFDRY